MPLYKILFTDNSTFSGGDTLEDSKWDNIPDKEIYCLEYFLSDNDSIVLKNYEAYAVFTEALDNAVEELGNCPKCGHGTKAVSGILTYGDGSTKKQMLARCLSKKKNKDDKLKCGWVGRIRDINNLNKTKGKRHKFIMGLKDGIVVSHRVSLSGSTGKDKYQTGDITKRVYPKGKEYRGKPISDYAWKKGKKEVK